MMAYCKKKKRIIFPSAGALKSHLHLFLIKKKNDAFRCITPGLKSLTSNKMHSLSFYGAFFGDGSKPMHK